MKTSFFSAAFFAVASLAASSGQAIETAPTPRSAATATTTIEVVAKSVLAVPDALVMADGSVLAIRGQHAARMEADVKLKDGSIVTPGGTVKRPDGSSLRLADGQGVSANGNIGPAPQGAAGTTVIIDHEAAIKPQ